MTTARLAHVNVSVTDNHRTAELIARLIVTDAGLTPFNHADYTPGPRSFYFFDWDGIEWEIVSYTGRPGAG